MSKVNPEERKEVLDTVSSLLEKCDEVKGRNAKQQVATQIYEYLLCHRAFLYEYPKLYGTVVKKLLSFIAEETDQDFVQACRGWLRTLISDNTAPVHRISNDARDSIVSVLKTRL